MNGLPGVAKRRFWWLCLGLTACHRTPAPPAAHTTTHAGVQDVAAPLIVASGDAGTAVHFDPHWACRIVGPGRVGRMPHVSTPPPRPGAPAGTVEDAIMLADGHVLRREIVRDEHDGVRLDRGRVALYALNDGGASGSRDFEVRPEEQELLFSDERGAGVAFWNGSRIVAERIGSVAEEVLADRAGTLSRGCGGVAVDGLRLWPVFVRALPFPRVQGMPPSTADARYTLARDAQGLCVVRLEGDGPWGRVFVDATADAGLRGDLSLSESINPVVCAANAER